MKSKSIKIFLKYILGPLVFLWLSVSVYHQLKEQPDLYTNLFRLKNVLNGPNAWKLYLVILLVLVNWGLEARKWQLLIKPLEELSFIKAFKATLSGVAFALNTPNRIGEYGGRVLYLKDGHRLKAVSLTVAGSFSQLLITLMAGTIGMWLMKDTLMSGALMIYAVWFDFLLLILAVIIALSLLLYFRIGLIFSRILKLVGEGWLYKLISGLKDLSGNLLLRVMFLSFFRFVVFIIQYNLVLQAMDVNINWWEGIWLVSILFLWLAIGPTITLLELGLRWEYSILLFGTISNNTIGIYAAASVIWLLNLVVPALLGTVSFLGLRLKEWR